MEWECSKNWKKDNACKVMIGEHEIYKQLGRSKFRWEDNININVKDTELDSVKWIRLTEGR
jgi:hypothetical protein